jgi:hypothetical protein
MRWTRLSDRNVWECRHGPRFRVEMHAQNGGWFVCCTVDGNLLDVTHLNRGPGVRRWVRGCWRCHVETLSFHERMDYIEKGWITEAD